MSAPLRLGLVGCGRIAERCYAPAARSLPDVDLCAVADPDRGRARRVARAGAATIFPDVEPLLAAGGVDALIVATPSPSHVEVARAAAGVGVTSLVEKPPAPDLDGALALAALDPSPAIAFNRRFLQGHELAGEVPTHGWLELVLELRFRRGGWGAHVSRDEALLDAGIHLIDLASFLTGSPPIAVRSAELAPERASLELELGRARARIRCATDRGYAERIEVRDRAGRVLATSALGGLRSRAKRLRGGGDPLLRSVRRQLAGFAALQRGEPSAVAGAAAAVEAMATVDAARRSAALAGAEVTVVVPTGARA